MKNPKVRIVGFKGNKRRHRLLSGIPMTHGMKSGYVVLQPGENVGEHNTESKEEAIVVLDGRIQVTVRGRPFAVAGPGQLVYIPAATVHDMCNTSTASARYIYIVAPVAKRKV